MGRRGLPIVLVAEDVLSDRILLQETFEATTFALDLRFAKDAEEFLDYLYHRPPFKTAETPDLILLDIELQHMKGRQLLTDVKRDPKLRSIPIIALATSRTRQDIEDAYNRGANTYIPKPISLAEMTQTLNVLGEFWFRICALPGNPARPRSP